MTQMKVAQMVDLMNVSITKKDIPVPEENEALVRVDYCGVCGSDLHFYEYGKIGNLKVTPPFVLGHEVGGTVVALGNKVKNLSIGDRVALEPQITCGKCEFCKSGKYNLCKEVKFFATPPINGAFQEYVTHEASLCHVIPANMDTMDAALVEPLAVGFSAATAANMQLGDSVLITGDGCIGLTAVIAANTIGRGKIVLCGRHDNRLATGKKIGATEVLNETSKDIRSTLSGEEFDIAIEASGSESAINNCIHLLKRGGTLVCVGYSKTGKVTLDMSDAIDKELTIKTIFRYRNNYPMIIDAISRGLVNAKQIVSDIYDFDDIQMAMENCVRNKSSVVKAVIKY